MLKKVSKQLSENRILVILLAVGSITWILTMIKSGLPTQWGIGFWGANGHDAIWHLALTNSLSKGALQIPIYAGNNLQNYHIGFDLLLALLSKTGISTSVWYFQILPIIFSFSIGILTYKFVLEWKKNKIAALWATFFVYFGGGFGWIVTLFRGQGFGGESMFWSQQSVSTLINPPFALSLIVLLSGLISLQKYLKSKTAISFLLTTFLFGILVEVKAYAGALCLGALVVLFIYELIRSKKIIRNAYLSILIVTSLMFVFFLKFVVQTSGSVFKFQPGWFLETMLILSDRFYWPKLYSAIFNWKLGHIYLKALTGYFVAFVIFIVGNLGVRLLGIYRKIHLDNFDIFLGSIFLAGIALPMLFVQEGTAWNTIQFFYYSLFVASLYAGGSVSILVSKIKKNKIILGFLFVLLTVPTTVSTLSAVYLPTRPPAVLPYNELDALNFLKNLPDGIVLTYPFDSFKAKEAESNPPRPLYLYDSTAYVSAFSEKEVFLEDEVNLNILGYDWKIRRTNVDNFYKSLNESQVREFLKKNNIKYIYWVKPQRATLGEAQLGIKNIYENKDVILYEVAN